MSMAEEMLGSRRLAKRFSLWPSRYPKRTVFFEPGS
jgi:hypothetical protein